jgi:hypothetical protein
MVPRIAWVDEDVATGPIAELYAAARAQSGRVPDIVKTFSGRPEALQGMLGPVRRPLRSRRGPHARPARDDR